LPGWGAECGGGFVRPAGGAGHPRSRPLVRSRVDAVSQRRGREGGRGVGGGGASRPAQRRDPARACAAARARCGARAAPPGGRSRAGGGGWVGAAAVWIVCWGVLFVSRGTQRIAGASFGTLALTAAVLGAFEQRHDDRQLVVIASPRTPVHAAPYGPSSASLV